MKIKIILLFYLINIISLIDLESEKKVSDKDTILDLDQSLKKPSNILIQEKKPNITQEN